MNLVFFLEEPSAREMLKGLLPRLLGAQVFPPELSLTDNRSRSFRALIDGLQQLRIDGRRGE